MERIEYYVMNLREEISCRIKRLRKAAGYSSAAAFADAVGLPTSRYTHYEQSNTSMPLEIAMAIAQGLGVSLDVLAYGEIQQNNDVEGLKKRIERLDARAIEELKEALDFIEFKANRRRLQFDIRPATQEEVDALMNERQE